MEHIFAQGAGCTDNVAGALLAGGAPAPGSGGNADSGGLAAPLLLVLLVLHWCSSTTGAPLLVQVSVVLSVGGKWSTVHL